MKRFFICILSLMVLISTSVVSFAGTANTADKFNDMKGYYWSKDYVNELMIKGAIDGYPDGTFKPSGSITVAEFVKIASTLGVFTSEEIVDMAPEEFTKPWSAPYMYYADSMGILPQGLMDNTANWSNPITREQMAYILEKTCTILVAEDAVQPMTGRFTDETAINAAYSEEVGCAVTRGLIQGYDNGTFKPAAKANRAEASVMLARVINKQYRVYNQKPAVSKTSTTSLKDVLPTATPDLVDDYPAWSGGYITTFKLLDNGDMFNLSFWYNSPENNACGFHCSDDVSNICAVGASGTRIACAPAYGTQCALETTIDKIEYFIIRTSINGVKTVYVIPNTFK